MPPDFVVFPSSTEEVAELCRRCSAGHIPITPHGTGTGLEGGTTALAGGVCIDVTRNMEDIIQVHTEDFCAEIQPGVTREGLNQVGALWCFYY